MIRRARVLLADLLDIVLGPLGWDVYVRTTHGLLGVDAITIGRRQAGSPRPRRLAARRIS